MAYLIANHVVLLLTPEVLDLLELAEPNPDCLNPKAVTFCHAAECFKMLTEQDNSRIERLFEDDSKQQHFELEYGQGIFELKLSLFLPDSAINRTQ